MVLQAIRYSPAHDSSEASLQILDQLTLPHRSTYFDIHTCEDAHAAIRQMRVRGAPAIAIVASLALAVQLDREWRHNILARQAEEVVQLIYHRLEYLITSRPTAVNLADAVGKLKIVAKKAGQGPEATTQRVVEQYINAASAMLVQDVKDNEAIGEYGAQWIIDRRKAGLDSWQVLTHCNTGSLATAGFGTALGVIRALHASNRLTRAYCTETRPYNQGSRLTAYELVHDQIPVTLITDSMAAALMAQQTEDMAAVIVGADRVAANGDTANKIGTYSLAILARHHGVKFLVAAPRTTIDLSTKTGAEIVIEERAAEEVTQLRGPQIGLDGQIMTTEDAVLISTAAVGVGVWNPAFDVTPADLIDGIVTEVGMVEKDSNGKFDLSSVFRQGICNGT